MRTAVWTWAQFQLSQGGVPTEMSKRYLSSTSSCQESSWSNYRIAQRLVPSLGPLRPTGVSTFQSSWTNFIFCPRMPITLFIFSTHLHIVGALQPWCFVFISSWFICLHIHHNLFTCTLKHSRTHQRIHKVLDNFVEVQTYDLKWIALLDSYKVIAH